MACYRPLVHLKFKHRNSNKVIHKTNHPFLFRFAFCQVLALLLLVLLSSAQAAEAVNPDTLPQAQAALKQITQQVAGAENASAEHLKALKKEIAAVRSNAQDCVQEAEPKIKALDRRTRHPPAQSHPGQAVQNGNRDPGRRSIPGASVAGYRPAGSGSAGQKVEPARAYRHLQADAAEQ